MGGAGMDLLVGGAGNDFISDLVPATFNAYARSPHDHWAAPADARVLASGVNACTLFGSEGDGHLQRMMDAPVLIARYNHRTCARGRFDDKSGQSSALERFARHWREFEVNPTTHARSMKAVVHKGRRKSVGGAASSFKQMTYRKLQSC